MRDKFIWNARKNLSFRASRIRNFSVDEDQGTYIVTAWVSDMEALKIGIFERLIEAQMFLDNIHEQIEGLNG